MYSLRNIRFTLPVVSTYLHVVRTHLAELCSPSKFQTITSELIWLEIAPTQCFDISTIIWDGSTTHLLDLQKSPQNRTGPPADQQIHIVLWIHLHISHSVLWIHLHNLYCIYCIVYYICTYCIVYIVLCIWREDDEGDEGRFAVGQLTPVPLDTMQRLGARKEWSGYGKGGGERT